MTKAITAGDYGYVDHSQVVTTAFQRILDPVLSPDSFLPLKPVDYHILFVLFRRELHGYAVVKMIAERTDGRMQLEPSNLYRRVRRLMKDGLVEESEARPTPELDDERRRYFTLTPLGRAALEADARRMRDLVLEAEAASILVAT